MDVAVRAVPEHRLVVEIVEAHAGRRGGAEAGHQVADEVPHVGVEVDRHRGVRRVVAGDVAQPGDPARPAPRVAAARRRRTS